MFAPRGNVATHCVPIPVSLARTQCSGSSDRLPPHRIQLTNSHIMRARSVRHPPLSPVLEVKSYNCAIAPRWLLHSGLAGRSLLGNYRVVAHEVEATVLSPESWEGATRDVDLVQLVRLCMIINDRAAVPRKSTAQ